jgi:3-isopropylmalate/(R)-2-methylmalate dehydratase large subunit
VAISEAIDAPEDDEALAFMGFKSGTRVRGTRIDVAFIGSCTNGRLSDLEEAARIVRGHRVAPHVKALIVPGSQAVRRAAETLGLHEVFIEAGFEWRGAGCSMCLGMNPDKLEGRQVSASSSNRNFKGRQGSPTGRTLLMSPAMVAAAAIAGEVVDVREMLEGVPA